MCKCKRCGRILKSPESIKRGYDKTCARIVELQKANKSEPEINSEIAFLKCEIKTLKRMFKQIQVNGVRIDPIERLRQNRPEQEVSGNKAKFGNVIAELKKKFLTVENAYDLLSPVDGITTIITPPEILI